MRPEQYESAIHTGMLHHYDRSVFNLYYSATKEHKLVLSSDCFDDVLTCAERCNERMIVRDLLRVASEQTESNVQYYDPFFRAASILCRRGEHLDVLSACLVHMSTVDGMFLLLNARRIADMSESLLASKTPNIVVNANQAIETAEYTSESAPQHTHHVTASKTRHQDERAPNLVYLDDRPSPGSSSHIPKLSRLGEMDSFFQALDVSRMMSVYLSLGMWAAARVLLDCVVLLDQQTTPPPVSSIETVGPETYTSRIFESDGDSSPETGAAGIGLYATATYQSCTPGRTDELASTCAISPDKDIASLEWQIDELLAEGSDIQNNNTPLRSGYPDTKEGLRGSKSSDMEEQHKTRPNRKIEESATNTTLADIRPERGKTLQGISWKIIAHTTAQLKQMRETMLLKTDDQTLQTLADRTISMEECKAQITDLQKEIEDVTVKDEETIVRHILRIIEKLPSRTKSTGANQTETQGVGGELMAPFTLLQTIVNPCEGRNIGLHFKRSTLADMYQMTASSLSQNGYWKEVIFLIEDMREKGLVPPLTMYENAVEVCGRRKRWAQVLYLHTSQQLVHPCGTDPMRMYRHYLKACASCGKWSLLYTFAANLPALGIVPSGQLADLLLSLSELHMESAESWDDTSITPSSATNDDVMAIEVSDKALSPKLACGIMDVGTMFALLAAAGVKIRPGHVYDFMTRALDGQPNYARCQRIYEAGVKLLPDHIGENACSPAYTDRGERTLRYRNQIDAITAMAFDSYLSTNQLEEAGKVWLGVTAPHRRRLDSNLVSEMWGVLFTKLNGKRRATPISSMAVAKIPVARLIENGLETGSLQSESEYSQALSWCNIVQDGTLTLKIITQMRKELGLVPSAAMLQDVLVTLYETGMYEEYTRLYESHDKTMRWAAVTAEHSGMLLDCYFALDNHAKALRILRGLRAK